MSRCSVCDYSDDYPSVTADGLTDGQLARTFRVVHGETVCSVCRASIDEVRADFQAEDDATRLGRDGQFGNEDLPDLSEFDHLAESS